MTKGLLILFLFPLILSAQPSNDDILQQLLKPHLDTLGDRYKAISGFDISPYFPNIAIDSHATASIKITPRVYYAKVDQQKYLRELKVVVNLITASKSTETFTYRDTLPGKVIRKVNKASSTALRSEDPTPLGKWIKPTILIAGSIGTIFSLFFLRSQ